MRKIIFTQDINAILEWKETFLNRSDVKIFAAAGNEEILALHKSERADLIIADLDSPDMTGEILVSRIRDDAELRKVSIILICSGSESHAQRCLQCGANAFVAKPVNSATLLQEVHQLLLVAPRRSFRVPLSIRVHVTSKGTPFLGYAENVSMSGMLLHSEAVLFEGDAITCSFYLPDSTHAVTNAEVVRVLEKATEHDANGYGIEFIDPGTQFEAAIKAFVEKGR
ncbi:MAG: response regulator [Nitrospirota bacterium]